MNLMGSTVNKDWLDKVVPNNSVIVSDDFIPHPFTANTTALQAIRESDPDPYIADLFNGMEKKGYDPQMSVSMRLYVGTQAIAAKNFEAFKRRPAPRRMKERSSSS